MRFAVCLKSFVPIWVMIYGLPRSLFSVTRCSCSVLMPGKHSTLISEHSVPTFHISSHPTLSISQLYDHPALYPACQFPLQLLPIVTVSPMPCSSLLDHQFEVKHSAISLLATRVSPIYTYHRSISCPPPLEL